MEGSVALVLLFLASGLATEASGNATARMLDWSGEIAESLGQLYDSQQGCDFLIDVVATNNASEPLELCAHSLILSANSEAQFLLRDGENASTFRVEEDCLPYVEPFIRYLYTRRISVTLSSVKCFHKMASSYRAVKLQEYCAQLFSLVIPEDPTFKAQIELYNYAQDSRDPVLEELCLQFLAWNSQAFSESEAWQLLSPKQLQALLARSDVVVRDELSLLRALESWRVLNRLDQHILDEIRFPMIPPEDLFQLQFNLSFYKDFEALFKARVLEALEFYTVTFQALTQHLNLTDAAFIPRMYTSPIWSYQLNKNDYNPYYSYYQSFQTPPHPSFLFKTQQMSWSAGYFATMQSCWSYGLSCTESSLPLVRLISSGFNDPSIRYENKVLMLCQGSVVTAVQDFKDTMATVPNVNNGSLFPCPDAYSSFIMVVRPMYSPLPLPSP